MVNVLQTGEYPVVLGGSLEDGTAGSGTFLGLKYNWTPKTSLIGSQGRLRRSKETITITYDKEDDHYTYTAHQQTETESSASDLVLIYDARQSVYVLQKLTVSLELNLQSSTDKSAEEIQKLPLLRNNTGRVQQPSSTNGHHAVEELFENDELDNQSADPSNPYDYRHFLAEAREVIDRASGATPLGGSGFLSPAQGSRAAFGSTTPQFGPTEIDGRERDPLPKEQSGRKFYGKTKGKQPNQRAEESGKLKVAKRGVPLSAERVVSSSSDEDEGRGYRSAQKSKPSHKSAPGKAAQSRNDRDPDLVMQDQDASADEAVLVRARQDSEDENEPEIGDEPANPYFSFIDTEDTNLEIEIEPDQDVDELILDAPARNSSPTATPLPPRIAITSAIHSTSSPPPPLEQKKQNNKRKKKSISPSASASKATSHKSVIPASSKPPKTKNKKSVTAASTTTALKRRKSEPIRQDTLDDDDGLGAMLEAALEQELEEHAVGLGIDSVDNEEGEKEKAKQVDVDGEESEISEEE